MSISLTTADPEADAVRRVRLRKMRILATGLLLFAAVVFLLTRDHEGVLGFVNAGAEASMVGAIADWFAVTALFRHPLGLPVPHTALVPKRKDEFGASLEEFFAENFLAEDVVRERLQQVDAPRRLGAWLAETENARRVATEGATVLGIGLSKVKDEDVAAVIDQALVPRLVAEPISPVAGSLLREVLADGAHRGLVDLTLAEAHRWLLETEDVFRAIVGERAPWWAPPRINDRVTHRLHLEALRWLEDIRDDPHHHARYALDSLLARLADDLLHDPETQERAEQLKTRMLQHPQTTTAAISIWTGLKRALEEALGDEEGLLRQRVTAELTELGRRVGTDADFRTRIERWTADLVVFGIQRYGDELTAIITHTINRWDGEEAARKIELHVGPDLQFIRINGTLVGGLVGVLIHGVTLLL